MLSERYMNDQESLVILKYNAARTAEQIVKTSEKYFCIFLLPFAHQINRYVMYENSFRSISCNRIKGWDFTAFVRPF